MRTSEAVFNRIEQLTSEALLEVANEMLPRTIFRRSFIADRFLFETCNIGRPIHTCGCFSPKMWAMVEATSYCIMLSWNSPSFLMFFPDDEGVCISCMVLPPCLFNASVVGSNDELFLSACLCNGLDDAAHITVEFFQFGVIFRSIVSGLMAYMVGLSKQWQEGSVVSP